jgi:metal-responsive CopG/Arc/MetJ family transcriptional regulator
MEQHAVPVSISLTPQLLAKLDDHAREQGLTRSEFVRGLFEAWLSYTEEENART